MAKIFMTVLSMSITASIVIAAVFLLRFLLKGAPRVFSYILWIVVFIRLLCPFFPESDWGIIPDTNLSGLWERTDSDRLGGSFYSTDGKSFAGLSSAEVQEDAEEKGFTAQISEEPEKVLKAGQNPEEGIKTKFLRIKERMQALLKDGNAAAQGLAVLWLAGCIGLLLHGVVSYRQFIKSLKDSKKEAEGRKDAGDKKYPVIISENIKAPFVAGFFRPVIYLPQGLDKTQAGMVCEHEKIHIVRRDYLAKPLAYLAMCVHWFNPFVWLAFHYMEKDMEISCDEAVLRKIGYERNKDYARTLLYLSREHSWKPGCPIAFGENSVKTRIKNAVRCRRAKTWVVIVSAVAVLAAAVLFFVNSNWKLVISLEEKEAVKNMAEDNNGTDTQGIPGTDRNSGADEIVYLPAERIAHTSSIPEGDSSTVTAHYYYAAEPENTQEDGKAAGDNYAVLLRQAEGIHEKVMIKYAYPLDYERVSDDYGIRIHPVTQAEKIHSGIDFAAEEGTPVKAAAAGVVFETGTDVGCGNYVIIQHINGEMTYYANCDEILAEAGESVEMGEQIATVGNTGYSTGAHLHYALSKDGEYVRPEFFY